MKTRIKGLMYDTNTATYIGRYTIFTDEASGSFTEALYYKRTGEFFVYCHSIDFNENDVNENSRTVRPAIIPMSFEDAKSWVMSYCSAYKLVRLFGDGTDEQPNKCSLSSKELLKKRELKAIPYLDN